jgi:signal transduction histidine kinase
VRKASSRVQPSIYRAEQDEQVASLRYRIEARAAAIMHDTLLNHLAALGTAKVGPLSDSLRSELERDLEFLIGEEWLTDNSLAVTARARRDWGHSEVSVAIEDSRRLGLDIDVTGDLAAVARLTKERSTALGLAVKQCLVNVVKHSGTKMAEVNVYSSESHVSVMVIDSGKGFLESETAPDRLGLRQSVRKRIEAVGGEVQVWSTVGRGTSIMITVPTVVAATDDTHLAAT